MVGRWLCAVLPVMMLAAACSKSSDSPPAGPNGSGTVVNGVRWADCNVVAAGVFVAAAGDPGGYHTFGQALAACPAGYRLPTVAELGRLVRSEALWTDGGYRFGGERGSVFLPAAGYIDGNNILPESYRDMGSYWSSTLGEGQGTAWALDFGVNTEAVVRECPVFEKRLVRCVSTVAEPEPWGTRTVIGGATWATHNVETAGVNTAILDYGGHFTFDQAQTACPEGYRLPTRSEFELLLDTPGEWTSVYGLWGRLYRAQEEMLFLPAAGLRDQTVWINVDLDGFYWSGGGDVFSFRASKQSFDASYSRQTPLSVRCVKE